jgi:hypothetical protein
MIDSVYFPFIASSVRVNVIPRYSVFGLGKVVYMEVCVKGGPTQHSFRAWPRSASTSGEVVHRDNRY